MAIRHRDFVYRDGRPAAIILDIEEYREMLERLDDAEDLRALKQMRSKPLKFRKLDDFLATRSAVRATARAV
jgi:hypothetical protein